ncbi:hypothetical protein KY308_01230 [Candidatus Woesearchaeota archaeon]|nr:hypothetical protein [Candidatus Woesearchaeota archaeon]
MKINLTINIEKKHFYFLVILICMLFAVGVFAYVNPATGVGHTNEEIESVSAEKIISGTFGQNVGQGDFQFPANAKVSDNIFFPNFGTSGHDSQGIFFGPTVGVSNPYIIYSNVVGLRISSGTATQKPVYIEGNLSLQNGGNLLMANNKQITAPLGFTLNTRKVTVTNNLTVNGQIYAPNNVRDDCYSVGWLDIGCARCGAWSGCEEGYFIAGIAFQTGSENDELDYWALACCRI